MTTRKITVPTDPTTGKPLNFKQMMERRKQLERSRRIEQRKAKEQATIDAALNPPPTFAQLMEQQQAQNEGRRQAAEKAEQEAAANRGPVNNFRQQAEALKQSGLYRPIVKSQYDRLNELADKWDREQAAAAEQAAKQAAIDNDPAVQLAKQYAEGQLKLTRDTDLAAEAAEAKGMADAGDAQGAWAKMKAIDEKLFALADKLAAEARQSKAVTDSTFNELATAAEQARERSEQSAAMVAAE